MITFTLGDEQLLKMLRASPQSLINRVELTLDRVGQEYARDMRRNAPESFGTLRNSIRMTNAGLLLRDIGAHTDYARMVDKGAGPGGWPTMQSIADWARRKHLQPMQGDSERDMVWKIRRAIARRGTKRQPFFTDAVESPAMRARAMKLLSDAASRAIEEAR